MENNYSLSDIASLMKDGNGLGSSAWLIILFVLIFGWGGNGFGKSDLNSYASNAQAQDILFGQKFQDLNSAINKVGDGIASLGYSQLQQMDANTASINGNITAEGRAIQTQLCAINSNIDNKFAALEKSQLEQRIAEQSQQINQLSMQQMLCGIPKVNNTAWGVVPSYPALTCGCNGNV